MNQMDICKYLARELGVVLTDDQFGFSARIDRCYCTILANKWRTRKVRGRRVTTGESAMGFLLDIHKKNGIEIMAMEAAFVIRDVVKHLQAVSGSVS